MELRKSLKKLVDDEQSKWGSVFNLFIKILIVLSLISISVETLPRLDSRVVTFLELFEVITVLIFSIEYILRVIVADKKLKFIFSFYGIIDLVAILPFYIATGLDLRSVRIFRLLRVIRMMKFTRYNDAVNRLIGAFQTIKAELVVFFMITLCVLYVSALGIFYFENPAQPDKYVSVFHSLWWSVATLTTVGYGDVYPITIGGRVFTFLILMIGLGLISVPTGLIASALTKTLKSDNKN